MAKGKYQKIYYTQANVILMSDKTTREIFMIEASGNRLKK